MEELYNKQLNVKYFKEILNNGLSVYLFYEPLRVKSTCAFGTPFGSLNIHQKLDDKEYNFNPGVAHFLEHKLFESEERNIIKEFSNLHCDVNAFTSYRETVYYFSTIEKDITKPLNLLLDFVQNFSVTKESVEKEKGIIAEEIAMVLQDPTEKLGHEIFNSLYKEFPIIYDIAGSKESVYKITKEELETAYRINYHPSNMILSISSNIEPNELIRIIKDNQAHKTFDKFIKPLNNDKNEPSEVNKKDFEFTSLISTNKQVVAYKLKNKFKDDLEANFYETCLYYAFELCFSPMNDLYQKWVDEKIVNDFFGFDISFTKDNNHFFIYAENDDMTVLDKIIKEGLNKDNLKEDLLEQIKRRNIGISIFSLNDSEIFTIDFVRRCLEGVDFFKQFEQTMSIKLKDVEKALDFVENSDKCVIKMKKELS